MYGNQQITLVNLDKRETVTLTSPAILLSSAGHVPANERGTYHDSMMQQSKSSLNAHKTYMGFMALIGPRDEMTDLLSNTDPKAVPNRELYGSWYGDRIITYGVTGNNHWNRSGNNPFKTNSNTFEDITMSVQMMGTTLLAHYKLTG